MATHLTTPIYYYDSNGYKIGPINKKELIVLAEKGEITPDTRITDNSIEVNARQIPKLKFYTPEYHRAEEFSNLLENINFDNIPIEINPEPVAEKPHKTNMLKWGMPLLNIFQAKKPTPQHNEYWYFRFALRTSYLIASLIFYSGLILTALAALACVAVGTPLLILIVLPFGTMFTIFFSLSYGCIADSIQWKINIEKHLKEIKTKTNNTD